MVGLKQKQDQMFNQLAASNGQRIGRKQSSHKQFLNRSQVSSIIPAKQLPRNYSSFRQKQSRLHHLLLDKSLNNPQSKSISEHIKARLRSRKIELPDDLTISVQPPLTIDPQSIRITSNDNSRTSPTKKRQFKTQQTEADDQQSQSTPPYKQTLQTLQEIDQLNRNFFQNIRREQEEGDYGSRWQQFSSPHRKLHRLNRKNDFERYVDNLQRLHSLKSLERRNNHSNSPIDYLDSSIQRKLPEISPKKEAESHRLVPSPSLQDGRNRNFISLLKKVNARGQSLLVKLRKFPSYKKIPI